jgi:hypothetical protein
MTVVTPEERRKQKAEAQARYRKTRKGKATTSRYVHSEKRAAVALAYQQRARLDAVRILGDRCDCPCGCQDRRSDILEIAHTNGDGKQHRLEIGNSGYAMSLWVKRNPDTKRVRLLCPSCHVSWDRLKECKGLTNS